MLIIHPPFFLCGKLMFKIVDCRIQPLAILSIVQPTLGDFCLKLGDADSGQFRARAYSPASFA